MWPVVSSSRNIPVCGSGLPRNLHSASVTGNYCTHTIRRIIVTKATRPQTILKKTRNFQPELSFTRTMRAMKNDRTPLDPRVQQVRMCVAHQLFAHQADHLKTVRTEAASASENVTKAVAGSANDDERRLAVDRVSDLLAVRPRYTSRRGHYLPYGLRAAGGR